VACLAGNRLSIPVRFSEQLAEQIDAWFEQLPNAEKPLLFREWLRRGDKAEELLGSLGVQLNGPAAAGAARARAISYRSLFPVALLEQRTRGILLEDVARRWARFTPMQLDGLDEQWRDTSIWLIGGQARLFDLRAVYHHLREECGADADRIHRVKKVLARIRSAAFDLQASLSYCSPLGPLLRGVRQMLRATKVLWRGRELCGGWRPRDAEHWPTLHASMWQQ
jgi:hypothetical protein